MEWLDKWIWRIGFLMNIGLGIPFYGGAVVTGLIEVTGYGEMSARCLLLYIPFLCMKFGLEEKLLTYRSASGAGAVFTAFWCFTILFPGWTVELLIFYLFLMVCYFYYVDIRKNGWRTQGHAAKSDVIVSK